MSDQLAAYFGVQRGVLVSSVDMDSPAARAGLKAGDVITSMNGRSVSDVSDVFEEVRRAGSGASIAMTVMRDRKEAEAHGANPRDRSARAPERAIDIGRVGGSALRAVRGVTALSYDPVASRASSAAAADSIRGATAPANCAARMPVSARISGARLGPTRQFHREHAGRLRALEHRCRERRTRVEVTCRRLRAHPSATLAW